MATEQRRPADAHLGDESARLERGARSDTRPRDGSTGCKDTVSQGFPTLPAPTLGAAVTPFKSGCSAANICELTSVRAFQVPGCYSGALTVDAVLPHLLEQGDMDPQWWQLVQPAGISTGFFFGTTYSSYGPSLLAAVNTVGGGPTPPAMTIEIPVACQGCYKFQTSAILLYPGTKVVVRLDGFYGYD